MVIQFKHAGLFWVYNTRNGFIVCIGDGVEKWGYTGPFEQWSIPVRQAALQAHLNKIKEI
jgi:hypothetical protein